MGGGYWLWSWLRLGAGHGGNIQLRILHEYPTVQWHFGYNEREGMWKKM